MKKLNNLNPKTIFLGGLLTLATLYPSKQINAQNPTESSEQVFDVGNKNSKTLTIKFIGLTQNTRVKITSYGCTIEEIMEPGKERTKGIPQSNVDAIQAIATEEFIKNSRRNFANLKSYTIVSDDIKIPYDTASVKISIPNDLQGIYPELGNQDDNVVVQVDDRKVRFTVLSDGINEDGELLVKVDYVDPKFINNTEHSITISGGLTRMPSQFETLDPNRKPNRVDLVRTAGLRYQRSSDRTEYGVGAGIDYSDGSYTFVDRPATGPVTTYQSKLLNLTVSGHLGMRIPGKGNKSRVSLGLEGGLGVARTGNPNKNQISGKIGVYNEVQHVLDKFGIYTYVGYKAIPHHDTYAKSYKSGPSVEVGLNYTFNKKGNIDKKR